MNDKARGVLEMSAAMAISGTIGWCVVRSGLPIVELIFWRCVFGAATLAPVCAALGMLRRDRWSWRLVGLASLGGVAIVANWLLIFAAYSRASISIATAVYNTQPFMLVGLGALFLGERLTTSKLLWLVVAFVGMLLIVQAEHAAGTHRAQGAGTDDYQVGILMALGAAFFYALAAFVTKKLAGTPPHLIALVQVCVGIVIVAPAANFAALPSLTDEASAWGTLVAMGVIYTGLVYILLYGAIQKLPTTLTGALSFIYPVVAIGVDYAAFGQRLQPAQIAGAAAILMAAAGMTLGWSWPGAKAAVNEV
jgi:drug/metabolite transporter (DMT)-like permease